MEKPSEISMRIAAECNVHAKGMTKTEFILWKRIVALEELRDRVDDTAWVLDGLQQIVGLHSNNFSNLLWKKHRTVIKGKLTRKINKLKDKVSKVRAWVPEKPVKKDIWNPNYEELRRW